MDDVGTSQLVETCRLLIFQLIESRVEYLTKSILFNMDSSDEVIVMVSIALSSLENKPIKKGKRKLWENTWLQRRSQEF